MKQCRECGSTMFLDDEEIRYKGNRDNYWCCESCQTSCIEYIRYGRSVQEFWHTENNDNVKDYTISAEFNKNGGLTMPKINNIPSCRFNSGVMCATSCTGEGCGWHPLTAFIRKNAIREERKKSRARAFVYTIPNYKGKCKLTYVTSYGARIVELRGMVNMSDIMELAAAGNTEIRFEYKGA